MREALSGAGLEGEQLSGLQMHGTGTSLGDPIVGVVALRLHLLVLCLCLMGGAQRLFLLCLNADPNTQTPMLSTSQEVGAAMEQLVHPSHSSKQHAHAHVHLLASKSIVGHAEPAAGILGLMYAVHQVGEVFD